MICLLFGALTFSGAAELIRGPYLQMGTPNSVIVKWRTDEPTNSLVRYGSSPSALLLLAGDDEVFTTEHEVKVVGLIPNRKYFYSIGTSEETLAPGNTNQYFITHPLPGLAKPTRIWAIGDCGTASAGNFGSHLVRNAYLDYLGTNHTDVWLMLGDNAYYEGRDHEYQTAVFETYPAILRNTILWSTLGNHETYGPDDQGRLAYFDIFTLPTTGEAGGVASGTEKYYSFDFANIHFVCLDSELSERGTESPMWAWLRQDLIANTKDWLIAFWHSPPYTKGSHDSDNLFDNFGNMTLMRTNFVSLLESYGVDLVLCGHSHGYERSYLINGHYGFSTSLEPHMIKDAGSGQPDTMGAYHKDVGPAGNQGAIYVVAGSAGWATFMQPRPHPTMYTSLLKRGSMVIDINDRRLDAKFLRETGTVDDHFTIIKGGPAEPFRVVVFNVRGNEVIVRWKSVAGRTYQVEQTPALEPPDWSPVSEMIVATGATTSWTNYAPAISPSFYRVSER